MEERCQNADSWTRLKSLQTGDTPV